MDRFEKMSIYAIDWKSVDNDGVEQVFTFKPLPFQHYPKIYKVLSRFQELETDKDLSEEEQSKQLINKLDEGSVKDLLFLEKEMVRNSYPELSDEKLDLFVMSNMFELIDPLVRLMSRAEKFDKRRTDAAK